MTAADAWDPAETVPGGVFTDDDRTVELGVVTFPSRRGAQAGQFRGDGKWYAEVRVLQVGSIPGGSDVGLAFQPWDGVEEVGGTGTGAGCSIVFTGDGYHNGSTFPHLPPITPGNVIRIAYDGTAGNVWIGNGPSWGGGDPVAGTDPLVAGITGELAPAISSGDTLGETEATLLMASADFFYSVPEGFEPWFTTAPTPGTERPYVVGSYLRAYFGADTPVSVWVRSEDGPLDLSADTLTVQATWPWAAVMDIPATGDADGRVQFTITQAMLWRTWGDDYGIATARFRGQRSLLRVISAQRGVLALAHLEIA